MYKVSLINRNFVNNNEVVTIIPELTKYFEISEDAYEYSNYLFESKSVQGFMPEVEVFELTQNLDVIELKRLDALSKLTENEKKILGI